ncbi:DNA (cytosine-5-)-methyltransferase [Hoeflea sp. YIM 152468]|uniref:DNA cytosine methyltransferase n=1 Tax=Hoeflea sp. YIM 152468 TaxID=3031759 RepID=UPI0023D9DAA5|nr:DNA (cytosine-5-)-methyltransferase [Hoeflea sp. YIM 152468]MDF1607540.1 DNA (cytosine-5-)-methyltransferase [Hoeflea sp. YIM 152468]
MTKPIELTTKMRSPMKVLSLCTGIAGDAAAFLHAGISHEMIAVAEFDPLASAVLACRFPGVLNLGDINAINHWKVYHGKVDLIITGIPCQPYSSAGRQLGSEDARDLSTRVCEIIATVAPRFILIENVPQFRTVQGGKPFAEFTGAIERAGYSLGYQVIDAQDFVPQRRKRLFLCAYRGTPSTSPSELLAFAAGGAGRAKPGGAICDRARSDPPGSSSVLYPPRLGTIMASGSGLNRAGMKGHEMDFYVVQEFPEWGLTVRRPTPLEVLRAQGFPDWWLDDVTYRGRPLTNNQRYQLVGNSWPVPVAAAILSEINAHWFAPASK